MNRETASKCENDVRKLKSERNSLKVKAEGLTKEMLKIKKSQVETTVVDKLKAEIEDLKLQNSNFQHRLQIKFLKMERRSEKKTAIVLHPKHLKAHLLEGSSYTF